MKTFLVSAGIVDVVGVDGFYQMSVDKKTTHALYLHNKVWRPCLFVGPRSIEYGKRMYTKHKQNQLPRIPVVLFFKDTVFQGSKIALCTTIRLVGQSEYE